MAKLGHNPAIIALRPWRSKLHRPLAVPIGQASQQRAVRSQDLPSQPPAMVLLCLRLMPQAYGSQQRRTTAVTLSHATEIRLIHHWWFNNREAKPSSTSIARPLHQVRRFPEHPLTRFFLIRTILPTPTTILVPDRYGSQGAPKHTIHPLVSSLPLPVLQVQPPRQSVMNQLFHLEGRSFGFSQVPLPLDRGTQAAGLPAAQNLRGLTILREQPVFIPGQGFQDLGVQPSEPYAFFLVHGLRHNFRHDSAVVERHGGLLSSIRDLVPFVFQRSEPFIGEPNNHNQTISSLTRTLEARLPRPITYFADRFATPHHPILPQKRWSARSWASDTIDLLRQPSREPWTGFGSIQRSGPELLEMRIVHLWQPARQLSYSPERPRPISPRRQRGEVTHPDPIRLVPFLRTDQTAIAVTAAGDRQGNSTSHGVGETLSPILAEVALQPFRDRWFENLSTRHLLVDQLPSGQSLANLLPSLANTRALDAVNDPRGAEPDFKRSEIFTVQVERQPISRFASDPIPMNLQKNAFW